MSKEPLGTHGLPPWDVLCIHYTFDANRTDVLMRASHIIGDGQLFMKLIKQIMEPLDSTARADYHHSITHARAGTPGVGMRARSKGFDSSASSSSASLSSQGSDGVDSAGAAVVVTTRSTQQKKKQQQHQQKVGTAEMPQQQQQQKVQRQSKLQQQQPEAQQPQQQQAQGHQRHRKQRGVHHWLKLFLR